MGATFRAYRMLDLARCDTGYGRVHRIRMRLLEHTGEMCGVGTDWSDRYGSAILKMDGDGAILDPLLKEMEDRAVAIHGSAEWEILVGTIAFCYHSDCDGDFYCQDCEYIAKAMRATLDSVEMDQSDRRAIEGLYAVFKSASEDGCRVEISRSRRKETDYGDDDMTDESNRYRPHAQDVLAGRPTEGGRR